MKHGLVSQAPPTSDESGSDTLQRGFISVLELTIVKLNSFITNAGLIVVFMTMQALTCRGQESEHVQQNSQNSQLRCTTFLTDGQRELIQISQANSQLLLGKELAEESRQRAELRIHTIDTQNAIDLALIRQADQAAILRTQAMPPLQLSSEMSHEIAVVTRAQAECQRDMACSLGSVKKTMQGQFLKYVQHAYEETGRVQVEGAKMVAGAIAGSALWDIGIAQSDAVQEAVKAGTSQLLPEVGEGTTSVENFGREGLNCPWTGAGGLFAGHGASGSWGNTIEGPSRWQDCAAAATSAALSCAKPASDYADCIHLNGGLGPEGLNLLVCGGSPEPSDVVDCMRETWEAADSCGAAIAGWLSSNKTK